LQVRVLPGEPFLCTKEAAQSGSFANYKHYYLINQPAYLYAIRSGFA